MSTLKVVAINGFQETGEGFQRFPKHFKLTSFEVNTFQAHGCAYESSFEEAEQYGIKPSDLRRGVCTVWIYSQRNGVWL
jgi:hypothetical protein